MRELWEEYGLKEDNIQVRFNPPSSFHALREQQIFEVKSGNFSNMSSNDMISNTYCQKKYLGWTDTDVIKNRAMLKKDKELLWELTQIEGQGPNWREGAQPAGEEGMGGGLGGTDPGLPAGDVGAPPDFGAPPDVAPEPPTEEPPPPPA